ncbi:hypothetical protein K0817_015255 [Microbacterium sp. HD4P20]|uniref:hypothetical protein n=1 Tax=Microbacterium sp. HD4P20 TaxID=2864874 RepID=UPI001C63E026|nr:hypothetical protein [Microbacterium sp. HD4P20]MCP2637909.1 hypothetical protein [Microbacterium sp. HD4P20]
MKRVIYAGSDFLTGDAIAAALLRYSEALAGVGQAETIVVPALGENGEESKVLVLVGPASQIMAQDVDTEPADLVVPGAVEDLEAKIRALTPHAVIADEWPDQPTWTDTTTDVI